MRFDPGLGDHLYVLLFAVLYPLIGWHSYRHLLRLIATGHAPPRRRLFQATAAGHWALMVLGMLLWLATDRPWSAMGFRWQTGPGFIAAAAASLVIIAFFGAQVRNLRSASAGELRQLEQTFGPLRPILPRDRGELKSFYGLSVTAGVVEEVLWRAILIGYLINYVPLWVAATVSAVGFGLAHAYQGLAQLPRVSAIGVVLVLLYLMSGSVWLPIVVHAAVDILQGRLAHDVLTHPALRSASSGTRGAQAGD